MKISVEVVLDLLGGPIGDLHEWIMLFREWWETHRGGKPIVAENLMNALISSNHDSTHTPSFTKIKVPSRVAESHLCRNEHPVLYRRSSFGLLKVQFFF